MPYADHDYLQSLVRESKKEYGRMLVEMWVNQVLDPGGTDLSDSRTLQPLHADVTTMRVSYMELYECMRKSVHPCCFTTCKLCSLANLLSVVWYNNLIATTHMSSACGLYKTLSAVNKISLCTCGKVYIYIRCQIGFFSLSRQVF